MKSKECDMGLFRRKSIWQRAIEPVTDHIDTKALTRSGLVTVVGAVTLTAASALVSAVRRRDGR